MEAILYLTIYLHNLMYTISMMNIINLALNIIAIYFIRKCYIPTYIVYIKNMLKALDRR